MILKVITNLTLLFIGIAFISSCKKDRLNDEKSIFVGEWEWIYSIRQGTMVSPPFLTWTDTIFPADVSSTYGLAFLKKGKVQLFENELLWEEYRTVFDQFNVAPTNWLTNESYKFEIDLDNKPQHSLFGHVHADSLVLRYKTFPFANGITGSSDIKHYNYFKKVD